MNYHKQHNCQCADAQIQSGPIEFIKQTYNIMYDETFADQGHPIAQFNLSIITTMVRVLNKIQIYQCFGTRKQHSRRHKTQHNLACFLSR
jgi:hypothetical protein